jgi:hypothetical protein
LREREREGGEREGGGRGGREGGREREREEAHQTKSAHRAIHWKTGKTSASGMHRMQSAACSITSSASWMRENIMHTKAE